MEGAKEAATMKTVWVYTNTSKQVGDEHHLIIFANRDIANAWLKEHDPEGVAFEYPVIGREAVK
jgi:hypothetical protein